MTELYVDTETREEARCKALDQVKREQVQRKRSDCNLIALNFPRVDPDEKSRLDQC